MLPDFPGSDKFWSFLLLVDESEAARVRLLGCRHCGGSLREGSYLRKPRGLPSSLFRGEEGEAYRKRRSFCCGCCRGRTLPPSALYFGRRVYVGPVFLLLSAFLRRGGSRAEAEACARLGVSGETLRRWRVWWRETFAASVFWRAHRGRFLPGLDEGDLPGSLLARFAGTTLEARLQHAVRFLGSGFASGGLIDGGGSRSSDAQ